MEKKTMDALRVMLHGELEEVAKQGSLTHESLDIMKDLLESIKNLEKIEKLESEKQMPEMGGYSQRSMGRYYVDGTYRNGNSYMGDYEPMYEGNSYYYPMYSYPIHSGRSMHSKESKRKEIIERLHEMKNEAADEQVKMVISEAIEKMNK